MKNLKKSDIIAVVLCLAAIIPGVIVYGRLPERIVTNWGMDGQPSGYTPKAFAVFGIPIMSAVFFFICCIYASRLEKKDQAGKLAPVLRLIFVPTLYLAQGTILLSALGKLKDIRSIVFVILSVTMIVLGNYMPKIRKNWIVGIRTPHILSSDEIWDRTHRFGGVVITVCGLIALVTSLLGHYIASFVIVISSVFIPFIYGEVIYSKSKGKD